MTISGLEIYISNVLNALGYSIVPEGVRLSEDQDSEVVQLLQNKYNVIVTTYNCTKDLEKFCYIVRDDMTGKTLGGGDEIQTFYTEREARLHGLAEGLTYVHLKLDSGIVVAIDGYPACGKSTIAKRLAKKVGYTYIDSGAMYRAVALYYKRTKEEINEETIKKVHVSFKTDGTGKQVTYLNGEDVEAEIRTLEIGGLASKIGVNDVVRKYLGDQQRQMGKIGGVVMDGRDIGTVVFPDAQLKLFMTANVPTRITRRLKDLGHKVTWEEVSRDIRARDYNDVDQFQGKRKAPDAKLIDNTEMSEDEQFELVMSLFKEALVNYRLKDNK